MTKEEMSKLLTAAGGAVADVLSACGVTPRDHAFAILIWPAGQPARVSSIGGGSDAATFASEELAAAFAAASQKAKDAPTKVGRHVSEPPVGHA